MEKEIIKLSLHSIAFGDNGHIPLKYTCEGENINPPLEIDEIPEGTESLAVILEDPDATSGVFVHWVLWNLPPVPVIDERTMAGIPGLNSFGRTGYGGPCPPHGTHRYYFRVFALDTKMEIEQGQNKNVLVEAMKGHILGSGELMGRYRKRGIKNES